MGENRKADTFSNAGRVMLSLQHSITIPVTSHEVEDKAWQSLVLIRDIL